MVTIKINNKEYSVEDNSTILQACAKNGIKIPTLCYLEGVCEEGSCGVCVVEVKGARSLIRSCITKVTKGMDISTNTEAVRKARKMNIELLLANHPSDCLVCDKGASCDMRQLANELGVKEVKFEKTREEDFELDLSSPSIIRDPNKCILCRRCVAVCAKKQGVAAIGLAHRGSKSVVTTFGYTGIGKVECVNCGQCVLVCPTGALTERSHIEPVWKSINDADKVVVVQVAPAVRAAIGEEFGMEPGKAWTGKMAAGLRALGFDKVFDTQFTADLTIMEEGTELIERINNKGVLPLITSCSPGWVKFVEHFFPGVLDHVSSCKSPQQMFGAVAKTYYAEKLGIDPRKMVVVSVMPCVAKKFEAARPEMNGAFHYWKEKLKLKDSDSFQDVDYVLTTRELAKMMKEAGIDFPNLPDEDFDQPLGISTGAGTIFGATGGVMEAALRTAYEVITGKTLDKIEFTALRGLEGVKTAEVQVGDLKVKVAVAHTLANARKLLDEVKEGKSPYHFIEIMACEGGCIGGGGQPIPTTKEKREKRAQALYSEDRGLKIRKSHENPVIKTLYGEFLGKPLGEKSHHLLHTGYTPRGVFPDDLKKIPAKAAKKH